ncbi:MAG TPA: hypothetical protein ENH82_05850 [bacterium]|nr:hypothetical protein [bacterium]
MTNRETAIKLDEVLKEIIQGIDLLEAQRFLPYAQQPMILGSRLEITGEVVFDRQEVIDKQGKILEYDKLVAFVKQRLVDNLVSTFNSIYEGAINV